MQSVKMVIDYSGMGYNDVMLLPVDTFQLMLKNAVIDRLNSTEQGREYLADCSRLKQTEPDLGAIRTKFNT